MLRKLYIHNYAIIDEISIEFSQKLNIITGETGAGKSILMGALSLILGERADTSVLLNREKKCFVEGVFDIGDKNDVKLFLKTNDLDSGEELIIRREISAAGKSRAFVNDTPVNLDQLRELSSLLVDLHQQFDSLSLGESYFQRNVLDAVAANQELLQQYQQKFHEWQREKRELERIEDQKRQFEKESDYNKFLFKELEDAALKENELEDSETELKLLNNSEGIKNSLSRLSVLLEEGEDPIVQQMKSAIQSLQSYRELHPNLPELLQRLQSAQIELQDIADEANHISNHVNYDPQRIEEINERLSLGYKLLKKHGLKTTVELLSLKYQLEEKLQAVLNIDETIATKAKKVKDLYSALKEEAKGISVKREAQLKPIQDKVNKLLGKVGMPNARFKIELEQQPEPSEFGIDHIEFLFDANKSNRFEPIRKVASGGELSRLMLSIKSLVAQSLDLPTMIFDEIDTGISGEAAKQVGIIMKDLAKSRQIISITHQPQIAGKADAHFFVYKEIKGDAIKTNIRSLNQEERIQAIAKMLSGEKPTAAAVENARELLN